MRKYGIMTVIMLLFSSTFAAQGMAQSHVNTTDFCQQHADLWDKDGRITLEGHKLLYLEHPDWWFDAQNKEWKEWPTQKPHWSLDEHHYLNTDGPDWWFDAQTKEWKEWPTNKKQDSLECHKKIYLSGPQWWFDAKTKEWKPWPK
jgi:hypothetical protein